MGIICAWEIFQLNALIQSYIFVIIFTADLTQHPSSS